MPLDPVVTARQVLQLTRNHPIVLGGAVGGVTGLATGLATGDPVGGALLGVAGGATGGAGKKYGWRGGKALGKAYGAAHPKLSIPSVQLDGATVTPQIPLPWTGEQVGGLAGGVTGALGGYVGGDVLGRMAASPALDYVRTAPEEKKIRRLVDRRLAEREKTAEKRWRQIVKNEPDSDAARQIVRQLQLKRTKPQLLDPELRNLGRAVTLPEFMNAIPERVRVDRPYPDWAKAIEQHPELAKTQPTQMLGLGADALAMKTRQGDVLKLSTKPFGTTKYDTTGWDYDFENTLANLDKNRLPRILMTNYMGERAGWSTRSTSS